MRQRDNKFDKCMKTCTSFLQKNKHTIIVAVILFFLPLVGCLVKILSDGMTLEDVRMAAMVTNDEVFYFKYVEGVLNYGHPMGFFGFNESRAAFGGGTAWSPVIMLHWIVWGLCFGWNYLSPILCNVAVMSLALFLFAICVKPTYFQTGLIGGFYLLYGQVSLFSLSGSPENFVYALLIVFIALAYKISREYKGWQVCVILIISMMLMTMRPYYVLLLLIPACFIFCYNRLLACTVGCAAGGISLLLYALISKYLCASYFGTSVIGMGLTLEIFDAGVWEGIKTIIKELLRGMQMTFYWVGKTFSEGNYQGRMIIPLFSVFFFVVAIALAQRKEKKKILWLGYWIVYFVIRYMAIILLYNRNISVAAIRHMFDFIIIGIIIIAVEVPKKKWVYICGGILGIVLLLTQYFVPRIAPAQENNVLNYMDEQTYADILELKAGIGEYIDIQDGAISYDNTVIWVFADNKDNSKIFTDWRYCYALPEGTGLSICYEDYVRENFDNLKCPYIMTASGGDVAKLCQQKGAIEIYNNGTVVIYNIRERIELKSSDEELMANVDDDEEKDSVLVLGDSILGRYRGHFSICSQLQMLIDKNVYNGAIGGACASLSEKVDIPMQLYSFAMISQFIINDNYSFLEYGEKGIEENRIPYIVEPISVLKSVDYNTLDYIIICYGTNDYLGGIPIESNWPQQDDTFKNALNHGIERLKEKCPNAEILLCSPMYGNYEGRINMEGDSESFDLGFGTMRDYITAMEEVAIMQDIIFVNTYDELGINSENWKRYYEDGIHPNIKGCELYAKLIAGVILE